MKTFVAAATAAVTALTGTVPLPAPGDRRPDTYVVSRERAVRPEGIAVSPTGTMYVTSVSDGAVYRGDVRDRELRPFLPAGADGRTRAAGVRLDRQGRIFVAGWDTGALFVYAPDGTLLARRAAAGAALNDLAITDDAVYVTDSATGVLWRAELADGRVGDLVPWLPAAAFPAAPGFLNGIVVTDGGRIALVADQGSGEPGSERLWRVDLVARSVTAVDVAGGQLGADGLLLEGNRLYGVVNFPDGQDGWVFAVNLAVLAPDGRTARVVRQSDTAGLAQSPTTIARDADRLLWVNSQLNTTAPTPPFTVTEVPGLC
ncbi:SMP-30/Gluconolaconase/LRE-like region-containing protein [Micromonospora echinaurantiaca]|uniref:SMP-30/Gluconolaconase/LRE-like region-containing protein n=1 Tax=Micromonospora echinaurantiaca TaxID=47857 RepID=A0A1C5JHW7_9ACTN|nr:superoxide dismutase [Micromonospora echinaurantiaca]SCG70088.1 SMP-30/Gluconolaconase/LRE-like region-containing protein [Micromonospora echinaurantiaca]